VPWPHTSSHPSETRLARLPQSAALLLPLLRVFHVAAELHIAIGICGACNLNSHKFYQVMLLYELCWFVLSSTVLKVMLLFHQNLRKLAVNIRKIIDQLQGNPSIENAFKKLFNNPCSDFKSIQLN